MTQEEKQQIRIIITSLTEECKTLEDLYLSSRHINYKWCKQSLEENVLTKLKKLL